MNAPPAAATKGSHRLGRSLHLQESPDQRAGRAGAVLADDRHPHRSRPHRAIDLLDAVRRSRRHRRRGVWRQHHRRIAAAMVGTGRHGSDPSAAGAKRALDRRTPGGAGAFDLHVPGAGDLLRSALHSRPRHPGADLRDARMGIERGGRPRRPARSRLCRVLRRRRLFLRAARDQFRAVVLGLPSARRHPGGVLGRAARLPGTAAARRLSRHRDACLRRDHSSRHHQLAKPDRRPERRQRNSAPHPVRHSADRRARTVLRPGSASNSRRPTASSSCSI